MLKIPVRQSCAGHVFMLAYVHETGAAVNSRFKPDASEIVKVDFYFIFIFGSTFVVHNAR